MISPWGGSLVCNPVPRGGCPCVCILSCVWLFVTPWTCQAPLSTGLPRQGYWTGLPFPSPGDLPYPGIEPVSLTLAGRFFITEPPGKPLSIINFISHHPTLPPGHIRACFFEAVSFFARGLPAVWILIHWIFIKWDSFISGYLLWPYDSLVNSRPLERGQCSMLGGFQWVGLLNLAFQLLPLYFKIRF